MSDDHYSRLLKADELLEFIELTLRGKKYVDGRLKQVGDPILDRDHINSIMAILRLSVNEIGKTADISDADIRRVCYRLDEELTDYFFMNWRAIEPKGMSRHILIDLIVNIVYLAYTASKEAGFRKDLFLGVKPVEEQIEKGGIYQ